MKYNLDIQDPIITSLGIKAIIGFYNAMSIDKMNNNGVFAFVSGVQSLFLNVVIDSINNKSNNNYLLNNFQTFFQKFNMPWVWFISPASYDNNLEYLGFKFIEEAPAMYFDLQNELPNDFNVDIEIQKLDRTDELKSWIIPIKEAYEAKEEDDSFRKLNYEILQKGSNQFIHFVATSKNKIVGSGTLFCSDDSVMLHNLATKREYTRQGIGTALTIFIMSKAKELGFKHCFLDSSEEGFNMYKRIGFKIYSTTLAYSNTINE